MEMNKKRGSQQKKNVRGYLMSRMAFNLGKFCSAHSSSDSPRSSIKFKLKRVRNHCELFLWATKPIRSLRLAHYFVPNRKQTTFFKLNFKTTKQKWKEKLWIYNFDCFLAFNPKTFWSDYSFVSNPTGIDHRLCWVLIYSSVVCIEEKSFLSQELSFLRVLYKSERDSFE